MDKVLQRIKEIKKELEITNVDLSRAVNHADNYFDMLISGDVEVTDLLIDQVCSKFYINKQYLLKGEGNISDYPIGKKNIINRINMIKGDLSISAFARKVGISQPHMTKIIHGSVVFKEGMLRKIADACNVGYEWLVYGDEKYHYFPVNNQLIQWLWENQDVRKELWEKVIS